LNGIVLVSLGTERKEMKKTGSLPFLLFILFAFTACTKETASTAPEVKTFSLKNAAGAVAGTFSIFSDKDGASVIAVELDEKSHHIGTTYSAVLYTPSPEACYARLTEVNAVIGYGETTGIKEASSGKPVSAGELCRKTGYQLKISGSTGIVARGVIQ
jgi:hypothetical protein